MEHENKWKNPSVDPRTKEMRIPLRGGSTQPPSARCSIRIIIQSPPEPLWPRSLSSSRSDIQFLNEIDSEKNHSISLLWPVAIDSDGGENCGHVFEFFFPRASLTVRKFPLCSDTGSRVWSLNFIKILLRMKEKGNNYEKIIVESFSREKENCTIVFTVFLN